MVEISEMASEGERSKPQWEAGEVGRWMSPGCEESEKSHEDESAVQAWRSRIDDRSFSHSTHSLRSRLLKASSAPESWLAIL